MYIQLARANSTLLSHAPGSKRIMAATWLHARHLATRLADSSVTWHPLGSMLGTYGCHVPSIHGKSQRQSRSRLSVGPSMSWGIFPNFLIMKCFVVSVDPSDVLYLTTNVFLFQTFNLFIRNQFLAGIQKHLFGSLHRLYLVVVSVSRFGISSGENVRRNPIFNNIICPL